MPRVFAHSRHTDIHRCRGVFSRDPGKMPAQVRNALVRLGFADTTEAARQTYARRFRRSLRPDEFTRIYTRGDVSVTISERPFADRTPFFSLVVVRPRKRTT